MKLICNSFVVTFIIAGIVLSQPKLSIDKTEIDMGNMCSCEMKEGKIILKNIGNDTLRIFHVETSCECTTVNSATGIVKGEPVGLPIHLRLVQTTLL